MNQKKGRYYAIEGGELLLILYILGLIAGTILFSAGLKLSNYWIGDFLDFTEYGQSMEQLEIGQYFSYILFIRIRQIIILFLCFLLFSPYVIFCVLDAGGAVLYAVFMSAMIWEWGWKGIIKGMAFLFPHGICYGAALLLIYKYLFQKEPLSSYYHMTGTGRKWMNYQKGLLDSRLLIAAAVLALLIGGCYAETYLNPLFLRKIL